MSNNMFMTVFQSNHWLLSTFCGMLPFIILLKSEGINDSNSIGLWVTG